MGCEKFAIVAFPDVGALWQIRCDPPGVESHWQLREIDRQQFRRLGTAGTNKFERTASGGPLAKLK